MQEITVSWLTVPCPSTREHQAAAALQGTPGLQQSVGKFRIIFAFFPPIGMRVCERKDFWGATVQKNVDLQEKYYCFISDRCLTFVED